MNENNNKSETQNKLNISKFISKFLPYNDIDKNDQYLLLLDSALIDSEIKNIAITGPYGAGKSSIIQSYRKQYSYRFDKDRACFISLANFNPKTKNKVENNIIGKSDTLGDEQTGQKDKENNKEISKQNNNENVSLNLYKVERDELYNEIIKQLLYGIPYDKIRYNKFSFFT